MSWPALQCAECPYTWDDVLYLYDEERAQLLDRLPLCPKNWKRVLDWLLAAYCEAVDGNTSKAKIHLMDAYTGIVEPFGDLYVCGCCIFYREAIKHVLDSTWANVLEAEHVKVENWKDTPEGQALGKFVEGITPFAKLDYRQRAAVYAIRAHCSEDPENLYWIQRAIHISPLEAQWYIDLEYILWDEDPSCPHLPYADDVDLSLVLKATQLYESPLCPSQNVKGCAKDCLDEMVAKMDELAITHKKAKFCKESMKFPDTTWVLDGELMRLAGRTIFQVTCQDPKFSFVKCTKVKLHKKKCTCMPEWMDSMISWMLLGSLCAGMHSPIRPALAPVPVYPMLTAALVQQMNGDVDNARRGLQKVCAMAPRCQTVHMRLALALAARPNSLHDKQAAARALDHAKKCERLYPDILDSVLESIDDARDLAAAPGKPAACVRKAGRRR